MCVCVSQGLEFARCMHTKVTMCASCWSLLEVNKHTRDLFVCGCLQQGVNTQLFFFLAAAN